MRESVDDRAPWRTEKKGGFLWNLAGASGASGRPTAFSANLFRA